ncbi:DUF4148 domain-containing protein [Paracandidimonas lactea]|uniref:DUF4148 domain-containing protein n=1 Tax=Paracandidimonas lactea TaxID=2895524 RepID=UPI001F37F83B|nr:DUF4148 domain-containing protein [Paracandidimonas lactea]
MKNVFSALIISFSLVAGAAQAANSDAAVPAPKTRAQVVAELQEARAQGLLSYGELDYPVVQQAPSSKTRQQVQAELAAARAAGTLSHGELDYPPAEPDHSTKTRAEVRAELAAAIQAGELPTVEY